MAIEVKVSVGAEFLADRCSYQELVDIVGEMDDYIGDWEFTNLLMDKVVSLLPNADSMGEEWMDDQCAMIESWYAKLGDLIRAHKGEGLSDG